MTSPSFAACAPRGGCFCACRPAAPARRSPWQWLRAAWQARQDCRASGLPLSRLDARGLRDIGLAPADLASIRAGTFAGDRSRRAR